MRLIRFEFIDSALAFVVRCTIPLTIPYRCARSVRDALTIADALCRSPKTVDGHREKIMEKLNIHNRGELVRYAIREGLAEV